ncbi:PREDICTED: uncharacterized protein LOC104727391 [Camelina sativa]|uniref:Uncharacterized protein LOC104727391 n=1 Tax=Camelina sativa TaxID=90675 RepID=A0ABM0UR19_CAMSA|nr:PREDICTED: uncharacterized protein LOC104727391 [Camelina sativa]
MMMIRALSTRKGSRGSNYKKLGEEEEAGAGLLQAKQQSAAVSNHHGQSQKVKVEKSGGTVHPLFSFFDMSLKRKKQKKKSTRTTAKPEYARYLEYVKEGGVWDNTSNEPVIYYR